ncbi:hypothetical protein AVEN_22880-1 [Araneus ventricosus]|uniref:Uncharacterized protein n=1 Tax=Araneus ventricosus TaxID=182803 RepID=A0A4Y2IW70_ARAVE|nr:hypothetical protein AVEN_22880-1 [Araneus ventricosus]
MEEIFLAGYKTKLTLVKCIFQVINIVDLLLNIKKRLERGDPGINRVDKVCKKHDNKYNETKDSKLRHIADQELLDDLDAIENPTNGIYHLGERQARAIIKAKKMFGLGLSKTNIYCVKCKSHTKTKDMIQTASKNNRSILKGICDQCGSKKCCFLGQIPSTKKKS